MGDYTATRLIEQAQEIAKLKAELASMREAIYNVWDGKQLFGKKDYIVCKDDLDELNALQEQESK